MKKFNNEFYNQVKVTDVTKPCNLCNLCNFIDEFI